MRKYKLYYRKSQGGRYYAVDVQTGRRTSLRTKDRSDAEELLVAMNDAARTPQLAKSKARAYLKEADERLLTRTWQDVMDDLVKPDANIKSSTHRRKGRAYKSSEFDEIRYKTLYETDAEDLMGIVSTGLISHSNYLKQLQNHALGMGWLDSPILPKKFFIEESRDSNARAVTHEEHLRIVSSEANDERRKYYEMLWLTGASQTDCAKLRATNFCIEECELHYVRTKSRRNRKYRELRCAMGFGGQMIRLLGELPSMGDLFPKLCLQCHKARGAEFKRRCKILGIDGISLKSYRYAWAERAYEAGIPEREAMAALGHGSRAVHRAYARGAQPVCRALPDVA